MNTLLNLKTSRKFALLAALAAIAILLPCWLYIQGALKEYDFAHKELDGVPVVRSLYALIRVTQEHRGLSTAALAGSASAAGQREAKAAEVSKAFAALTEVLANSEAPATRKAADPLLAQWKSLADDVAAKRVDGPQSFARHTALVEAELAVVTAALDDYSWAIDPEIDTYYSITGSAMDGLQLTERLGRLRALGAGALARKNLSPEERLRVHAQLVLADDSYNRSKGGLDKAGGASAAMARAYKPLQQKLDTDLRAALKLTQDQVIDGALAIESQAYFAAMTDVIRQQFELNEAAAAQLEQALDARAAATRRSMSILIVGLALAALAYGVVAWAVASGTTRRLREAQRAAEAMAAGDLSLDLAASGHDELGQLQAALCTMQGQLSGIVTGVRRNAEYVASASQEIAQGNNDLSARTEQQAAALEETAASMEEMNGTIRQNADHSQQANQLVATAASVAKRGGDVVARVVDTMQSIDESSGKIADITGVIDGIAFQTNILALNAAVEAARAGEQGRGFAVVAGEVRTLAQRSAQAAKEIKTLIGTSTGRVKEGSMLVREAGDTMAEVVDAVHRVADIVAGIAAASREQATGVGQISEAVAGMDQATQQNAALVEESAAAAQSLNAQAAQLVQAVSVFRVGGSVGEAGALAIAA